MKLRHSLRDLRNTKDAILLNQIEDDHPPNWNTDRMFEKSYHQYLEQSSKTSHSDVETKHSIINIYRTLGLVACLLVTVGLGVGVWSKQQSVEMRFAPETTTTTHMETTEQYIAEIPTVESEIVRRDETTSSIEEISESDTSSETSEIKTTNSPQTVITEESTLQNPGFIQSQSEVETEKPISSVIDPTEPSAAVTTAVTNLTEPSIMSSETEIIPTEPNEIDPTEPTGVTTEVLESVILDESLLPWFVIEQVNGFTQIRFMQSVEPSPEEWVMYTIDSDEFIMTEDRVHPAVCEYRILIAETMQQLSLYQYERTAFIRGWALSMKPEVVQIGENYGVLWTDAENEKCGLLWDDGKYTFIIDTSIENTGLLMMVAETVK